MTIKAFLSKAEAAPLDKDRKYNTNDAEIFFDVQTQPAQKLSRQELSQHRSKQAAIFMTAVAQELNIPLTSPQGLVDQIITDKPAVATALQRIATRNGLIAARF